MKARTSQTLRVECFPCGCRHLAHEVGNWTADDDLNARARFGHCPVARELQADYYRQFKDPTAPRVAWPTVERRLAAHKVGQVATIETVEGGIR